MSWMQSRQQQQAPPPPAAQTSSEAFSGQQQWQQQGYNNQTQSQGQNSNNWHNNSASSAQNTRTPPQNWQRQSLQQTQQTSPYFPKPQPPAAENYVQQQQVQQHQQYQQQPPFQTASYQQTQNRPSSTVQPNGPVNSQKYYKTDQMTTQSQGFDGFDNPPNEGWGDWDWNDNPPHQPNNIDASLRNVNQNTIEDSFKTEPNDNWQWNVEEKQTISLPGEQRKRAEDKLDTSSSAGHGDIRSEISDDFSTNHSLESLPPQQNLEEQHYKTSIQQHSLNFSQTPSPVPAYNQHQVSVQSVKPATIQQTVHSVPVSSQQHQRNQQVLSLDTSLENTQHANMYLPTSKPLLENTPSANTTPSTIQQSTKPAENVQNPVGSPVYVSQAKPVAQPPRQYAISPSVSGESTPIQSLNNQIPVLTTSPPIQKSQTNSNQTSNPLIGAIANIPQSHPPNSQSPSLTNLPPPPSQSPPNSSGSNSIIPPPPPIGQSSSAASNNPYKRAGVPQHHRDRGLMAPAQNSQQPILPPQQFYAPPPEEFQSQQNQEYLAPDNSEIVDRNFEVENQEVAPSNDRNRYLQTSHLSEEGYSSNRQDTDNAQDQNNEFDHFPPPGLSRLVLGQPEIESRFSNQPEIPPGFDRMIPGTELAASDINMQRQADGQDTIPSPRSAFANVLPVEDNAPANIDITADRNLYLVPGESDVHVQRVVTGVENGSMNQGSEQREVELDGENLEDEQQPQHLHQHQSYQHEVEITREEPIEGANTLDGIGSQNHETESSLTIETNQKDVSNASTGNDDSDHRDRHNAYLEKSRRSEEKKRRPESSIDKMKDRYESEESDLSSERERRRYREGSVRNDRGRESKERDRKDKRDGRERDRYRDEKDRDKGRYDRDRQRDKYEGDRDRGKYDRNRYETDSRYETESSTRYERRRTDRERDRDRDRDRDRYENDYRRDEKDRRYKRERRDDRDDRERDRKRGDRDYRDDRDHRRERENRDKNRSDYDEEYRKSRNDRDKERLREKDPRYAHMYNYPPGYSYDLYYQQQKYYEQLRRTNPQAYSEWYHKYYGQMQGELMANDGRESVHSGRSSANNDKERYSLQAVRQYLQHPNDYRTTLNSSMIGEPTYNLNSGRSTGNLSHLQHQLPSGYLVPSSGRSYYAQSEYSETTRHDNLSLNLLDESSSIQEPQRSTPCKFTNEHSTVSLSAGVFVCVKPKYSQNGITNVVKILKLGANDSTRKLFQSFPGPLVRGLTHKKTIIEFCEDQIRLGPPSITMRSRQNSINSICSIGQANKASFTLMWNLLILLLRQNGMVVGTDIAELLMKNKNQFPYDVQYTSKSVDLSRRDSVQSDIRKSKDNTPSDGENDVDSSDNSNGNVSDESEKKVLTEEEITEKFRNYLLYGNVNEALEWAAEKNLWGHALFLASKVDRRSHANVMMKFANKLALNDPLQTLYQLMSGRTPSSVTSVQDEKWGDWRPHLAMILSNTSQKPELNRKAITTLGDSLYNRGDLFGAQFCYLMAQVEFGRYSSVQQDSTLMSNSPNAVRLVLLGSSQHKIFREFATNESIMMTEIYEYACSLNDEKFSIVEFQPYKYLLGLRMLDYGFQLKTLMYMEQISLHIQRDPSKYEPSFIEKVYNMADRLKYYDPVLEKTIDDQQDTENNQNWYQGQQQNVQFEDQKWIQDLRNILNDFSATGLSSNNIYSQGYNTVQTQQPSAEVDNKALIDQQFSEINQQFSELTMQYNNYDPMQQVPGYPTSNDTQYQQPQPQQVINQQQDGQQTIDQYGPYYGSNQVYNSGIPQPTPQDLSVGYENGVTQSGYMQPQATPFEQQHQIQGIEQSQQSQQQPNSNYDYWGDQQQQQNEIQRPTISMPNSLSNKPGFYEDQPKDESISKSLDQTNQKNMPTTAVGPKKSNAVQNDAKNQNKNTPNLNNNSGWFGGIWNKLSLKPKNQMILPDDKNPTIVWDPEKKKWVNTDGEDAEQENFKPPPKMSDISQNLQNQGPNVIQPPQLQQPQQMSYGQPQVTPAAVPQSAPSPMSAAASNANTSAPVENAKTPSLQSNMFKLQRNRTLKKSYVDVFNPSGAQPSKPVEPVLAPAVPAASVPQSGFFIPAPVSADGSQQQQQQQQQQQGVPHFYNPNQFSGYQQ